MKTKLILLDSYHINPPMAKIYHFKRCEMCSLKLVLVFIVLAVFTVSMPAQNGSWNWAQHAGGSSDDRGVSLAMDSQGNLLVCGWFTGQATFGGTSLTAAGSMDIFVGKLSSSGSWLWVKQAGGTASCEATGIAVDANNEIYVCGVLNGTANFGIYQLSTQGETDVFVSKLSTDGDWLWAERGGGANLDAARDIDVAPDGSVYVAGSFYGTATFGNNTFTSPNPSSDIFVARLDPTGGWLWAKQAGGINYDDCFGITESGSNVYITGYFYDTAAFGDFNLSSVGNKDIYVAKLDASTGNWFNAWQAGGSDANIGTTVNTDGEGNVYLSGSGGGVLDFGSINVFAPGSYISKLSPQGEWLWAIQVPGGSSEKCSLRLDQNSNLIVAGSFSGVPSFGSVTLIPHGGKDIFVAGLSPQGNWLWAKAAGGNGDDLVSGMAHHANGNSYISGTFNGSCEFDGITISSAGMKDVFVAGLNGASDVEDGIAPAVSGIRLGQNFPNPFSSSSQLRVMAEKNVADCELMLYDLKGRKLQTIYRGYLSKGEHSFSLDGFCANLDSGVYFIKLKSGDYSQVKKLVKVR